MISKFSKIISILLFFSNGTMPLNGKKYSWERSKFFNTRFLTKRALVRRILVQRKGFKEVHFTSEDGLQLNGLYRSVENAPATIILTGGFFPGKLEGLASFVKLLDKKYNILLFNARGHGKSQGLSKLLKLGHYGKDDYNDMIGAIKFAHTQSTAPIIIHGTCSGAFHAAHALIKLADQAQEFNIKGLVFDSGWAKVSNVCVTAIQEEVKKVKNPVNRTLIKGLSKLLKLFFYCKIVENDSHTQLHGKMRDLTIPVLYIHSLDDTYAPFIEVFELFKETPQARSWWIPNSQHACHWLKYKHTYAEKLEEFCTNLLT